jgi:hypothetical protein
MMWFLVLLTIGMMILAGCPSAKKDAAVPSGQTVPTAQPGGGASTDSSGDSGGE